MRIIIFNNKEDAETRNKSEACDRGCSSVTSQWWRIQEGVSGEWALLIADDSVPENVITVNDTWFK